MYADFKDTPNPDRLNNIATKILAAKQNLNLYLYSLLKIVLKINPP